MSAAQHMRGNKLKQAGIVMALLIATATLSFTRAGVPTTPAMQTARYYDEQISALLTSLGSFARAAKGNMGRDSLLPHFFACRNAYKRTELFTDVFNINKARLINGPDLLKIDEENPSDSMKPHGFQAIERILYDEKLDNHLLTAEIKVLTATIQQLRSDPERAYYFTDENIWVALRLGMYRLIAMGITGFDVPISLHALPEAKTVLAAVQQVSGCYRATMHDTVARRGDALFKAAYAYLHMHRDFNTFDRLTFIRQYINPISAWLAACGGQYVNAAQLYPLNPNAANLFAADIINIDFFAPNKDYLPTAGRVALGKKLFYDPILSGNGSRSCASCHKPELAFTDGLVKPADMTGRKQLLRNTPTLWNSALQTAQFYDSRTRVLERQLSAVVHNTDEMNGSLSNSVPHLAADTAYNRMFRESYAGEGQAINEYNIANAVSSYIRTLISFNSRFDRYMRHETDSMTVAEKNGFNLFMGKARCGTCHYAPFFNGLVPPLYYDTESETLAVPATDAKRSVLDTDEGRYCFTRHPFHKYSFKTPTVRNSTLTAPYMHNGVFSTLEAVIDFYNDGGGAGRGIDLPTQTLPADKLGLTAKEKKELVAFLGALTDTVAIK